MNTVLLMKKISLFILLMFIAFLQFNLQAKDLQVAKQLTSIIPSVAAEETVETVATAIKSIDKKFVL